MVEIVNQAEGAIHDIETKIEEYKDQLPSEEVKYCVLISSLYSYFTLSEPLDVVMGMGAGNSLRHRSIAPINGTSITLMLYRRRNLSRHFVGGSDSSFCDRSVLTTMSENIILG